MKAFKVIYQHGHFIDKETNQRIVPVQGAEYVISASAGAFTLEDAKLKISSALSESEKAKWVENKYGKDRCIKIEAAGTRLFFRIGNSKKADGDENRQYIFLCTLLEDLYLFQVKNSKGDSPKDWRAVDCKCILDECLLGDLTMSEKIPSTSLNKLFSHTVMFYFSLQRSGSCDIFKTFFFYTKDLDISHYGALNERYEGIGSIRDRIAAARKNRDLQ